MSMPFKSLFSIVFHRIFCFCCIMPGNVVNLNHWLPFFQEIHGTCFYNCLSKTCLYFVRIDLVLHFSRANYIQGNVNRTFFCCPFDLDIVSLFLWMTTICWQRMFEHLEPIEFIRTIFVSIRYVSVHFSSICILHAFPFNCTNLFAKKTFNCSYSVILPPFVIN